MESSKTAEGIAPAVSDVNKNTQDSNTLPISHSPAETRIFYSHPDIDIHHLKFYSFDYLNLALIRPIGPWDIVETR